MAVLRTLLQRTVRPTEPRVAHAGVLFAGAAVGAVIQTHFLFTLLSPVARLAAALALETVAPIKTLEFALLFAAVHAVEAFFAGTLPVDTGAMGIAVVKTDLFLAVLSLVAVSATTDSVVAVAGIVAVEGTPDLGAVVSLVVTLAETPDADGALPVAGTVFGTVGGTGGAFEPIVTTTLYFIDAPAVAIAVPGTLHAGCVHVCVVHLLQFVHVRVVHCQGVLGVDVDPVQHRFSS